MTPPLDQSLSALAREAIELAWKATAGDWIADIRTGMLAVYAGPQRNCLAPPDPCVYSLSFERMPESSGWIRQPQSEDDAAFIAHARNSIERISRGYLEAVEENEFLRSKAYSCESLFQTLAAHLGGDETMRALGFDPERIRLAQQEIKDGKFVTWEVLSKELLERAASPSKPSDTGSVADAG